MAKKELYYNFKFIDFMPKIWQNVFQIMDVSACRPQDGDDSLKCLAVLYKGGEENTTFKFIEVMPQICQNLSQIMGVSDKCILQIDLPHWNDNDVR